MAGGAEVVWWDAGDHFWLPSLVKLKQVTIGPYIGAVHGDVNGDVAHDANVIARAVRLQIAPLPLEFKLDELVALDLFMQFAARALESNRLVHGQITVPFSPCNVIMNFFERHE